MKSNSDNKNKNDSPTGNILNAIEAGMESCEKNDNYTYRGLFGTIAKLYMEEAKEKTKEEIKNGGVAVFDDEFKKENKKYMYVNFGIKTAFNNNYTILDEQEKAMYLEKEHIVCKEGVEVGHLVRRTGSPRIV